MLRRPLPVLTLLLSFAFGAPAVHAETTATNAADTPAAQRDLRETYTKYEYRIPMRDGTRLFTVVYVPKDASKRYPFLVNRTPYSVGVFADGERHYGVDWFPKQIGPSKEFEDAGYIFVKQDVRGRYMSEGKWVEMTPHAGKRAAGEGIESQDMYDTMEWLLKHVPNNNSKAGIYGISYPGFYTSASIIDSHPAIKAASPQAPVTDLYMGDDSYHGGAFMLAANFGFYASFTEQQNPTPLPKTRSEFDYGTADAYDFFLQHLTMQNILGTLTDNQRALLAPTIEHDTYDAFWKTRAIAPHLKNIRAAVLSVGGWFDAEDPQGPITTYHAIRKNGNPGIFNGLVLGPWVHGGWAGYEGKRLGQVSFDRKTGEDFRANIQFPFFEQHLKGVKPAAPIAEVTAFETGSNVWRHYNAWPPLQAKARTLYFGANGKLGWQQPAAGGAPFDEYVADPRKPVPYIGYATTDVPQEYMVSDQRFAASRPDVLVYQSEVLEDDVTVAGPVTPKLFVSTSGTDADWVVKLIDVYPAEYPGGEAQERGRDVARPASPMAGYQMLVRGNPLRGKFRNSFEQPEPFTPGKVEAISYHLGDVNHTFRRGHRIMVQVQSSWFPLVDLNPQAFVSIPKAKPEDFKKATQRVYHAPETPSGLQLLVMPAQ
jgi:putative CocE/NonD family hydrolase